MKVHSVIVCLLAVLGPMWAGAQDVSISPAPALPPNLAEVDRSRIFRAAAEAMHMAPVSVTQARAPLSKGGPHDFYSNGDYWWPNPKSTNGLPYVQRDGESNPGNFNAHRKMLRQLSDSVAALGAAYKITSEDRYAAKAARLLQVFFIDPGTRMNTNLQYAQAVPGVSTGRSTGIIDTLHIIEIPQAVEAMESSPAFPLETLSGLQDWFSDYLRWLRTSANGIEEGDSGNNHAVAYWLQVAVFAKFTGDDLSLRECRRRFREVFVAQQMAADGSFPAELRRTKPYGYSIFQLDNMATLCQVLTTTNIDMWHFSLPDGRGMQKAIGFMYPYLADKSTWPFPKDVNAWDSWPARQPSLYFAGLPFNEQKYFDLWSRLPADPANEEVRRNIAITQPILWVPGGPAPNSP